MQGDHDDGGMPPWVKVFGLVAAIVVLLVVVVMALGFGGEHGPGRHLPGGSDTAPSSGDAGTSMTGGPASEAEAARTIEVAAFDAMAFGPSSMNVSAGEVVTFVVTNRGEAAHEFVLGDAAMQQQRASQWSHMGALTPHDSPNSIHLASGQTGQLTWRFGEPGTLEYACHEPGHYGAGMRGRINVA